MAEAGEPTPEAEKTPLREMNASQEQTELLQTANPTRASLFEGF
jgi:hypothetical protein